eukprot:6196516-Pleurochrysis_carterae.AAC.3
MNNNLDGGPGMSHHILCYDKGQPGTLHYLTIGSQRPTDHVTTSAFLHLKRLRDGVASAEAECHSLTHLPSPGGTGKDWAEYMAG